MNRKKPATKVAPEETTVRRGRPPMIQNIGKRLDRYVIKSDITGMARNELFRIAMILSGESSDAEITVAINKLADLAGHDQYLNDLLSQAHHWQRSQARRANVVTISPEGAANVNAANDQYRPEWTVEGAQEWEQGRVLRAAYRAATLDEMDDVVFDQREASFQAIAGAIGVILDEIVDGERTTENFAMLAQLARTLSRLGVR